MRWLRNTAALLLAARQTTCSEAGKLGAMVRHSNHREPIRATTREMYQAQCKAASEVLQ